MLSINLVDVSFASLTSGVSFTINFLLEKITTQQKITLTKVIHEIWKYAYGLKKLYSSPLMMNTDL